VRQSPTYNVFTRHTHEKVAFLRYAIPNSPLLENRSEIASSPTDPAFSHDTNKQAAVIECVT
jgi:hypothetical protein